jgi:hypothetical protein
MSNQDEESKESKDAILPSYQFFSPDLNYNYFTDQSTGADAPLAVTPAVLPTTKTSNTVTPNTVTSSLLPKSPTPMPNPVMPTIQPYTYVPVVVTPVAAAPVVEVEPEHVPDCLPDDGSEPTFEERVAAMEREVAAADAASAAARAAEQAAAAKAAAAQSTSDPPAFTPYPVALEPISAQYLAPPEPLVEAATSGEWNAFAAIPTTNVQDVCSPDFNFNRSLLKIFWRIDIDHNNRVSKNELATALQENWFQGDERVLAKLLFDMYEEISPEAVFCDAGLSVNNILSFGPFGDMVAQQVDTEMPQPTKQPERNNAPAKKKTNNKSSQSLRSMFKR